MGTVVQRGFSHFFIRFLSVFVSVTPAAGLIMGLALAYFGFDAANGWPFFFSFFSTRGNGLQESRANMDTPPFGNGACVLVHFDSLELPPIIITTTMRGGESLRVEQRGDADGIVDPSSYYRTNANKQIGSSHNMTSSYA